MKILISCGGTGGHLAPGIALAEGLISRGHTCWLLISEKKVDKRLIQKYPNLDFVAVPGAPFSLHPLRFWSFACQQARGIIQSVRIMCKLSPDLLIGFGGFSTAGVAVAAFWRGVPLVLHESNRVAGRATRALQRLAYRIYLPPGVRLRKVSPETVRHFGCPVRREIRRLPVKSSREKLRVEAGGKLLVVLGGSQGAATLNDWVREHFKFFADEGIHVYCVTGMNKGNAGVVQLESRDGQPIKAHFVPFTDNISELLSAADLVVTRAGAGTINELIRCRVPSILIPYPFAADNHQWANALFVERQGGGIVIGHDYIGDLHREVVDLIFNDWLLRTFRGNLERMDREDCVERIMNDLENICDVIRSDSKRVSGERLIKRSAKAGHE